MSRGPGHRSGAARETPMRDSLPPSREALSQTFAVGYARRSTDRQEQSIPDQQRAIEGFCEQRGLRLLRWYVDDAISGTSSEGRKGFQSLIADAQKRGCDFGSI